MHKLLRAFKKQIDDNVKFVRAMHNEWTTKTPTEDGWYWVYEANTGFSTLVYWGGKEDGRPHWIYDELSGITHWLGPLSKPDPPN